jgi:hypothetical protein
MVMSQFLIEEGEDGSSDCRWSAISSCSMIVAGNSTIGTENEDYLILVTASGAIHLEMTLNSKILI